MRRVETAARGRSDQRRDRPQVRRPRRAVRAIPNRLAVTHPGNGIENDLALNALSTERRELLEASHRDHRSGQRSTGSRDASPETEDRDRLLHRREHFRSLLPANPMRNLHRELPHVVELFLAHRRVSPLDGPLERRRSAQPVSDRSRQVSELFKALRVGHCRFDDAVGSFAVGVGQRRLGCERARGRG